MFPVFINSFDEDCSFPALYARLIEICNEHKDSDRALAFAIILYDFTNESLIKSLRNEVNWEALNEISGKHLTVFSIHSKRTYRVRAKSSNFDSTKGMQMMVMSSSYLSPKESELKLIDKYFGGEIKFPSLLFFQVDNENVIDSLLIELKEKGEEQTYFEVKEYIIAAVKALKKILPENHNNNKEIFRELQGNVEQVQAHNTIRKVANTVIPFIKIIKGISHA